LIFPLLYLFICDNLSKVLTRWWYRLWSWSAISENMVWYWDS